MAFAARRAAGGDAAPRHCEHGYILRGVLAFRAGIGSSTRETIELSPDAGVSGGGNFAELSFLPCVAEGGSSGTAAREDALIDPLFLLSSINKCMLAAILFAVLWLVAGVDLL